MDLSCLRSAPGSTHRVKRLGCGESSGHGKTCGKGHKGQKARSGGSIRLGFEGGQMPLARKIPKRGFSNARFREDCYPVDLASVGAAFSDGGVVDLDALITSGLVREGCRRVKLLGDAPLGCALVIVGVAVSSSALKSVVAAGGRVE